MRATLAPLHRLIRADGRWLRCEGLQASIAKLKRLKSFILSWNDLAMLPPEIGQLPSLEKLDVVFNKVRVSTIAPANAD